MFEPEEEAGVVREENSSEPVTQPENETEVRDPEEKTYAAEAERFAPETETRSPMRSTPTPITNRPARAPFRPGITVLPSGPRGK